MVNAYAKFDQTLSIGKSWFDKWILTIYLSVDK